jgi:hypothetical protein|tara:strand:- start:273 stop:929 length:657 start_codon:yes stop_codon:yes gene_type:complete
MTISEQEHMNQQKTLYDTAMKYDIKQDSFEDFIGIFETDYDTQPLIDFFEEQLASNVVLPRNSNVVEDKQMTLTNVSTLLENETNITFRTEMMGGFLKDYVDIVQTCYAMYAETYKILHDFELQALNVAVQKTEPGQGYHRWHCEQAKHSHRVAACMMYLNDDFDGGETEFLYQNKRIVPKRGQFLIWPATYTHAHRGNPPLSGKKYITTSWIEQNNY